MIKWWLQVGPSRWPCFRWQVLRGSALLWTWIWICSMCVLSRKTHQLFLKGPVDVQMCRSGSRHHQAWFFFVFFFFCFFFVFCFSCVLEDKPSTSCILGFHFTHRAASWSLRLSILQPRLPNGTHTSSYTTAPNKSHGLASLAQWKITSAESHACIMVVLWEKNSYAYLFLSMMSEFIYHITIEQAMSVLLT